MTNIKVERVHVEPILQTVAGNGEQVDFSIPGAYEVLTVEIDGTPMAADSTSLPGTIRFASPPPLGSIVSIRYVPYATDLQRGEAERKYAADVKAALN